MARTWTLTTIRDPRVGEIRLEPVGGRGLNLQLCDGAHTIAIELGAKTADRAADAEAMDWLADVARQAAARLRSFQPPKDAPGSRL
ncbi:hypothetical protein [Herbidospora mongoliensis]|uniref:hypothetical protein n=1 Tax=Herbidospora mongoliensis TaxID=688067 RepID=UPI000830280B|nr:hypothetical protein [Herbidospora mongoliensis]